MLKTIYLTSEIWPNFCSWLLVDRKVSDSQKNINVLKSRFGILARFFQENDLPMTRGSFNLFIGYLKTKNYQNSYINGYVKLAKQLWAYSDLKDLADYTYFKENREKLKEVLTPDEIKAIADCRLPYIRNADEINIRMKAFYYFMALVGPRIGEALNIAPSDIMTSPTYMVRLFQEKIDEPRYCPIPEFLYKMMMDLCQPGTKYIFATHDVPWVNSDVKKRCVAVGIKKNVTTHTFRHSLITELLKNSGVPLIMVSRYVGHKSVETTSQYYFHVQIEELRDNVLFAHPLVRQALTMEALAKRVKELLDRVVDKGRFVVQINETDKSISLDIRAADFAQ